jgi:hypothetical protein
MPLSKIEGSRLAGEGVPEEDFHLSDQMRFQAHDSGFRRNDVNPTVWRNCSGGTGYGAICWLRKGNPGS